MAFWQPVGATPIPKELPLWLLVTIAILIVVMLVASTIIILVGRWARTGEGPATSSGGLLSQFRLMYEQGECTREEYERIRNRLAGRIRQELDLPDRKGPSRPSTDQTAISEGPSVDQPPLAPPPGDEPPA
jgi:hypothetical protein